jgi:hypothetical protein
MVVRKEDLRTLLPKLSLQRLMTWKVSLVEAAVGGCESRAAAATATAARIWAECQKTCPHFLKKIGKLTAHPGMSEARGGGADFGPTITTRPSPPHMFGLHVTFCTPRFSDPPTSLSS